MLHKYIPIRNRKKMANSNLTSAKRAKNDEFYTQYHDIEKEITAYIEYNPDLFRGKTVLLPCDDRKECSLIRLSLQYLMSLVLVLRMICLFVYN